MEFRIEIPEYNKISVDIYIDENTVHGVSAYLTAIRKINQEGKPTPKTIGAVNRLLHRRAKKFVIQILKVLPHVSNRMLDFSSSRPTPYDFKKCIDITECFPKLMRYGVTVLCKYDTRDCYEFFICKVVDSDGIVYRFMFERSIDRDIAKQRIAYAYGGTVPP